MSKVVYKVSSTAKVEQMEAELSVQLSALRTEIEENGPPLETPSKSYRYRWTHGYEGGL